MRSLPLYRLPSLINDRNLFQIPNLRIPSYTHTVFLPSYISLNCLIGGPKRMTSPLLTLYPCYPDPLSSYSCFLLIPSNRPNVLGVPTNPPLFFFLFTPSASLPPLQGCLRKFYSVLSFLHAPHVWLGPSFCSTLLPKEFDSKL